MAHKLIGKSADSKSPSNKAGQTMSGSKITATVSNDGPPKPSPSKHGSGFITKPKAAC